MFLDFNKEVLCNYGSFYEEFVMGLCGVFKCLVFVIDKEGIVCYVEVLDNVGDVLNFEVICEIL